MEALRKVSRLRIVPYNIMSASCERPGQLASNITSVKTTSCWGTASGGNHTLLLRLKTPTLLGFLKIHNKGVSCIEVAIATKNAESEFITVASRRGVPLNKCIVLRCGFLPARYVRIRCVRGAPVSLYSVQALGVPKRKIADDFGESYEQLLSDVPHEHHYNPVKPKRSNMRGWESDALHFFGPGPGDKQTWREWIIQSTP
eukprot:TRINITY_DN66105_c12_g4_i1.p2 TRINITY_DN66105_c12_g4~~TRINITY_DN66105_c12_g4_i1.p2  ORF type:complete len:225 (-),score=103.41 TRINITY_DN66105_c12_g4_i1:583-1185(-)